MLKALTFVIFETTSDYATDEEAIVRAIKAGDERAFETLAARLRALILALITRYKPYDNDDLYQDALILLYHSAKEYDPEKCDSFRPYYLKLLQYRVKDWYRKERRSSKYELLSLNAPASEDGRVLQEEVDDKALTPEERSIYNDLLHHFNPVSLGLSPFEDRLSKHLIAGKSLKEFAQQERRPEITVRNAYSRLKQKVLMHLMR